MARRAITGHCGLVQRVAVLAACARLTLTDVVEMRVGAESSHRASDRVRDRDCALRTVVTLRTRSRGRHRKIRAVVGLRARDTRSRSNLWLIGAWRTAYLSARANSGVLSWLCSILFGRVRTTSAVVTSIAIACWNRVGHVWFHVVQNVCSVVNCWSTCAVLSSRACKAITGLDLSNIWVVFASWARFGELASSIAETTGSALVTDWEDSSQEVSRLANSFVLRHWRV